MDPQQLAEVDKVFRLILIGVDPVKTILILLLSVLSINDFLSLPLSHLLHLRWNEVLIYIEADAILVLASKVVDRLFRHKAVIHSVNLYSWGVVDLTQFHAGLHFSLVMRSLLLLSGASVLDSSDFALDLLNYGLRLSWRTFCFLLFLNHSIVAC